MTLFFKLISAMVAYKAAIFFPKRINAGRNRVVRNSTGKYKGPQAKPRSHKTQNK